MQKYQVRMNTFMLILSVVVGVQGTLDFQCYRCICELVTNCKEKPCTHVRCNEIKSNNFDCACGPFMITPPYWMEAMKPSLDGNNGTDEMKFKKCVESIPCSRLAVQYYLEKKAEDCDGNNIIDCNDYVLIHNFGAQACLSKRLDEQKQMKFDKCMGKMVKVNDVDSNRTITTGGNGTGTGGSYDYDHPNQTLLSHIGQGRDDDYEDSDQKVQRNSG
ncbi:hypothetical protein HHI36_013902 [Cryptolaemus montrouzieri]|uniref:lysozyme n=1 Tax=Cryptolaemus montrouzieri TaxID=559131 RepID=A0ABD2N1Q0_9CUCU